MRQEGVQPGKVITVSNIETAMQLVGENIGVGFLIAKLMLNICIITKRLCTIVL